MVGIIRFLIDLYSQPPYFTLLTQLVSILIKQSNKINLINYIQS